MATFVPIIGHPISCLFCLPLDFSSGPRSDTKGNLGRPPGCWLGPLQGTLKNGKVLAEIFAAMATGDYEWSMMLYRLFYTCGRHKIEACGPVALWVRRCLRGVMMTLTTVFGDFGGSSRPLIRSFYLHLLHLYLHLHLLRHILLHHHLLHLHLHLLHLHLHLLYLLHLLHPLLNLTTRCVMFPNGEIDPWQTCSVRLVVGVPPKII